MQQTGHRNPSPPCRPIGPARRRSVNHNTHPRWKVGRPRPVIRLRRSVRHETTPGKMRHAAICDTSMSASPARSRSHILESNTASVCDATHTISPRANLDPSAAAAASRTPAPCGIRSRGPIGDKQPIGPRRVYGSVGTTVLSARIVIAWCTPTSDWGCSAARSSGQTGSP